MNAKKTVLALGAGLAVALCSAMVAAIPQQDQGFGGKFGKNQAVKFEIEQPGSPVAKALAHSAEVKLAEAKVRQAELELTQVRMDIVRKTLGLVADLQDAEREFQFKRNDLDRARQLAAQGVTDQADVQSCEAAVVRLDGQIQRLNTELAFLCGDIDLDGGAGKEDPERAPSSTKAEEAVMAALDRGDMEATFEEAPIQEVLDLLTNATGLTIANRWDPDAVVDVKLKGSRRQALAMLADQVGAVFVVREYGLLMIDARQASDYPGPRIPDGVPSRR